MAQHTNTGAAHAAPTRRALLGGAGIVAAIAASPVLASLPTISAFDRRLSEWKAAFDRYTVLCAGDDPDEDVVADYCRKAGAAYHALLAEPATDARGITEKLHALCQWSEGCVIEGDEVERIGAEAAAVLKGGR